MPCDKKTCRTLNLAVMSLDSLKRMDCALPRPVPFKVHEACPRPLDRLPPPPGPISVKKIIVCNPRPVEYQCQPVPCVCPPCPPCETPLQAVWRLTKTGGKLFILYSFFKWTSDQQIWGGHFGTAKFTLEFMEKHMRNDKGGAALPNLMLCKYHILNGWDKLIATVFYYSFALPLRVLSPVATASSDRDKARNAIKIDHCQCS